MTDIIARGMAVSAKMGRLYAKDFGVVGDGNANDATAISTMLSFIGSSNVKVVFPAGTYRLSNNVTFPTNVTLSLLPGAIFKPDSGVTLTYNIVEDCTYQIFDVSNGGTISTTYNVVRPDWWGNIQGAVAKAINALPSTGGTVQLLENTYQPNGYQYGFGNPGVYMSKDNITIKGVKMPEIASDCKSLVNGSIIQGIFLVYANNFKIENVGIDCGYNVVQTYYVGTVSVGITEGLWLTYPDNATKNANPLKKNVRLHNVVGLAYSPNATVHSMLMGEGYSNVIATGEIVGCYGQYGCVIKCEQVKVEQLTGYANGIAGVIIKSDVQTYGIAQEIQIGKITTYAGGPPNNAPYQTATGTGYGVRFEPYGNYIDKVQIGSIYDNGHQIGVGTLQTGTGFNIANLQIGRITADNNSSAGVVLDMSGATTGILDHCDIGSIVGRGTVDALQLKTVSGVSDVYTVNIGTVIGVNCSGVVVATTNQPVATIGKVIAENCTEAVFRLAGTPTIIVNSVSRQNTATLMSTSNSGTAPALENGWTNYGGSNPVFGVDLEGGRVNLRGLIKPGTSNYISVLPTWARPTTAKRFVAQAYNNSTVVAVPVTVGTDGSVIMNEIGASISAASAWLSLDGLSYSLDY